MYMCVCVYFEIINFELELYMCVCVYLYTEKYIFIAYYTECTMYVYPHLPC